MKNLILITGGAGFIGGHLAGKLAVNNNVVIFDNLSTGKLKNIPISKNVNFIKGDVTDYKLLEEVIKTYDFDYIYHLAAVANVQESIQEPLRTHEINANSTLRLLELVKKHNKELKKIVFASSAAVYGPDSLLPNNELGTTNPTTPYGIDKLTSEKFVLSYADLFHIKTTVARFFNVYGPRQNPASPYSGVISLLNKKARSVMRGQKEPFIIYGNGHQIRDFVYVTDVIKGLILLGTLEVANGQVYNLGSGVEKSLLETISVYNKLLNIKIPVEFMPDREGDIGRSCASIEKIQKIGYVPMYSLEQGIEELIKFDSVTEIGECS